MRVESSTTVNVVKNSTNEQAVAVSREQQKTPIQKEKTTTASSLPDVMKEKAEQEVSEEEVIKAIEKANDKFQYYNTHLEFSIHEKTKGIMVKVYRDDELIREIPPEKILDMVAHMLELAGLLVDETV